MIDIIGLGPGAYGQLTVEALALLEDERTNYFRTAVHPVVTKLEEKGITFKSFDHLYEESENFDAVYHTIAETLVEKAEKGESFIYAVPGNPLFAEQSVRILIELCKKEKLAYKLHSGVSFVDVAMRAVEADPVEGMKLIDAFEIQTIHPDTRTANLITQVYNKHMASEVKLALMDIYPDDFNVVLITAAGVPEAEKIKRLPLYTLDWEDSINHLTTLYIPPYKESLRDFDSLVRIMRILRSPGGCPWDREQTHASLKSSLLEETYEVLDAIEAEDYTNLQEELGDLLFQIVFHAQLGEEAGYFTIRDVEEGISRKMINRHPHVFKQTETIQTEDVLRNWDEIKKAEKQTETIADEMARIPKAFTALMEANKIQQKAAKVGFDWKAPLDALTKVPEETEEVRKEIIAQNQDALEEELGDLLFAVVNVARLCRVEPEQALRKASAKFRDRFETVEKLALSQNRKMEEMTLEALDALWDEAKNLKKARK